MATVKELQSEANSTDLVFTFDEVEYTIPPVMEWDVEVFEAEEAGKFMTCIQRILGPEQYALFKGKKRTMKDALSLMEAMYAGGGEDPKE